MELQTISQVTKAYGVSTRTLRYYEQVGLIQSRKKEEYSYRVYDDDAVKRLQQIIILRKLQIPVKKISVILKNPKTATVIDIFKENISEIEKEMTALATIKFILEKFVSEIEKITAVQLSLDLLSEDSVQKLAESLSLIPKNIKENFNMDQLNQANETLIKTSQKYVRVAKLPPATIARIRCQKRAGTNFGPIDEARNIMEKFMREVDLVTIKPDFRYFGYGDVETYFNYFVTIPENLEVPAPLMKETHPGGLYASCPVLPEDNDRWDIIEEWVENSEDYEWRAGEERLDEHFNPYNIYGLQKEDSENWHKLLPIKEIENRTEDKTEKLNKLLKNTENLISQNKVTKIDL